ncbi:hypothetical protein ACLI1A_08315 [Flavobacterium sp. RHBU_3]|uniref:hypothetical protein n=1 Tax=Flavobacterium sp. RHBU_3 TaxID=3391184 RepID=UPI003984C987
MITNNYLKCLKELESNVSIELVEDYTKKAVGGFPEEIFLDEKEAILDFANIKLKDKDIESFDLASTAISWRSLLSLPDVVLKGGFVFNGITDALILPTDYFKNTINIKSDEDYSQTLGWFERLPMGVDDSLRGCFIKEEGNFPPPVAFFNGGGEWYVKLDFDYYKYMELLFENYGFKGWQYFYIDIVKEIPRLDQVLDDMRVAVKTLPLLFPEKDWSYHIHRYNDTIERLK